MAEGKPIPFDEVPVVCIDPIPTVVVDGFWGCAIMPDSVRINLVEYRVDESAVQKKHVVARLVISKDAFPNILGALNELWQGHLEKTSDGRS